MPWGGSFGYRHGAGHETTCVRHCHLLVATGIVELFFLLQQVVVENDFFLAVPSTHFHVFFDNTITIGI